MPPKGSIISRSGHRVSAPGVTGKIWRKHRATYSFCAAIRTRRSMALGAGIVRAEVRNRNQIE